MDIQTQYVNILNELLALENTSKDRTGVGTYRVFFRTLSHDLSQGFPLITLKKVFFRGVFEELMWMLKGETNSKILEEKGINIWKEWADASGDLGPIYGKIWRNWPGSVWRDQIRDLIDGLRDKPHSRRHVVSVWNIPDLPNELMSPQENISQGRMALAPCHYAFQMFVENGKLSCLMHMRSSDVFLGLPFNIAQYALLTHIIASQVDLVPGMLHITLGDTHLYANHVAQAQELVSREPYSLPKLSLTSRKNFEYYEFQDVLLANYKSHPAIVAPVAV